MDQINQETAGGGLSRANGGKKDGFTPAHAEKRVAAPLI
jgi:hypothetical protein